MKGGNVTVKVQTKVQNDGDAQVAAKIRTTVLDAEVRQFLSQAQRM